MGEVVLTALDSATSQTMKGARTPEDSQRWVWPRQEGRRVRVSSIRFKGRLRSSVGKIEHEKEKVEVRGKYFF
jgi:hypothetical protein